MTSCRSRRVGGKWTKLKSEVNAFRHCFIRDGDKTTPCFYWLHLIAKLDKWFAASCDFAIRERVSNHIIFLADKCSQCIHTAHTANTAEHLTAKVTVSSFHTHIVGKSPQLLYSYPIKVVHSFTYLIWFILLSFYILHNLSSFFSLENFVCWIYPVANILSTHQNHTKCGKKKCYSDCLSNAKYEYKSRARKNSFEWKFANHISCDPQSDRSIQFTEKWIAFEINSKLSAEWKC